MAVGRWRVTQHALPVLVAMAMLVRCCSSESSITWGNVETFAQPGFFPTSMVSVPVTWSSPAGSSIRFYNGLSQAVTVLAGSTVVGPSTLASGATSDLCLACVAGGGLNTTITVREAVAPGAVIVFGNVTAPAGLPPLLLEVTPQGMFLSHGVGYLSMSWLLIPDLVSPEGSAGLAVPTGPGARVYSGLSEEPLVVPGNGVDGATIDVLVRLPPAFDSAFGSTWVLQGCFINTTDGMGSSGASLPGKSEPYYWPQGVYYRAVGILGDTGVFFFNTSVIFNGQFPNAADVVVSICYFTNQRTGSSVGTSPRIIQYDAIVCDVPREGTPGLEPSEGDTFDVALSINQGSVPNVDPTVAEINQTIDDFGVFVWGEPGSGSGDGGLSAGWKAFAYIGGPLLGAALVAGLGVVVWRTWRRAQRRGSYDELAERDLG